MFKPLPLFIGLRYVYTKRRNRFISLISLISMLGIALGVTVMITVMSVMNGFEKELRARMLSMVSHVVVQNTFEPMQDWQTLRDELLKREGVVGIAPYIQGQTMLTRNKRVQGALLHGVEPELERSISKVQNNMTEGHLDDLKAGEFGVLIGVELAALLGLHIGDKVTVVVPQATVTPVGVFPRMKRMTVKGIFRVGMNEFDSHYIIAHVADVAKLLRIPTGAVQGLNLQLNDLFAAPRFARELRQKLPFGYNSYDWTYRHANFFRAVKMEKTVMFIILALIIPIAAFNIVSTLMMMVTDKQADIAILRTLGATPFTITNIFIVQGAFIGIIGTMLGLAGGISLALNVENIVPALESLFNVEFLSSDVYYISDVPSELRWADVYWTAAVSIAISFFTTLYPSLRAARVHPAEALRYE